MRELVALQSDAFTPKRAARREPQLA